MRPIVLNEHTLGYVLSTGSMGVLAGRHDPKNGPAAADPAIDRIRPATQADFDAFRVSSKYHLE